MGRCWWRRVREGGGGGGAVWWFRGDAGCRVWQDVAGCGRVRGVEGSGARWPASPRRASHGSRVPPRLPATPRRAAGKRQHHRKNTPYRWMIVSALSDLPNNQVGGRGGAGWGGAGRGGTGEGPARPGASLALYPAATHFRPASSHPSPPCCCCWAPPSSGPPRAPDTPHCRRRRRYCCRVPPPKSLSASRPPPPLQSSSTYASCLAPSTCRGEEAPHGP